MGVSEIQEEVSMQQTDISSRVTAQQVDTSGYRSLDKMFANTTSNCKVTFQSSNLLRLSACSIIPRKPACDAMKAIEMYVRKLSMALENSKCYKIISTLTLFNKWLMVSVRLLSNGCTQESGVTGDSRV